MLYKVTMTLELGNVVLREQGKGEFAFDLENSDTEIKGIAMLHEKTVPLFLDLKVVK